MNCAKIQRQIIDELAAGQLVLKSEATLHVKQCAACQAYYDEQRRLFASIGSGLEALANVEVPPSVIPRIRARVAEQPSTRRLAFYVWGFAALAVATVLLLGLGLIRRRPAPMTVPAEVARTSIPEKTRFVPAPETAKVAETTHKRVKRPATRPPSEAPSESATQVIVLAEEREAFARFVAEVPENPAVAVALTHPAPKENDAPVEIALVVIKSLEVKPLEQSRE